MSSHIFYLVLLIEVICACGLLFFNIVQGPSTWWGGSCKGSTWKNAVSFKSMEFVDGSERYLLCKWSNICSEYSEREMSSLHQSVVWHSCNIQSCELETVPRRRTFFPEEIQNRNRLVPASWQRKLLALPGEVSSRWRSGAASCQQLPVMCGTSWFLCFPILGHMFPTPSAAESHPSLFFPFWVP